MGEQDSSANPVPRSFKAFLVGAALLGIGSPMRWGKPGIAVTSGPGSMNNPDLSGISSTGGTHGLEGYGLFTGIAAVIVFYLSYKAIKRYKEDEIEKTTLNVHAISALAGLICMFIVIFTAGYDHRVTMGGWMVFFGSVILLGAGSGPRLVSIFTRTPN